MKTIMIFQHAEISKAFASKVLGGGELSTTATDAKKFDNLTISTEVTGLKNKALVAATGGATSGSFTTSNCTTSGGTVTCTTTEVK